MRLRSQLRPLLVRYRHFGIRVDDVFVASYPRSGSTWLRFMLYEILTGSPADFGAVNQAIPYAGGQRGALALLPGGARLIKTHELYRARARRAVYLVRDVRAVLPSMYRQQRRGGYARSFEAFVEEFVEGDVGPFGSWAEHVDFWTGPERSIDEELLLIRFEDMRADPAGALRKILSFIEIEVESSTLTSAIRDNDLRAMKRKEREAPAAAIVNRREDLPFVGSGVTEGWRELDATHLARVELAAGDAMRRMGYTLVSRRDE